MRVLVTGGAGFIGHHLVGRLIREGHEVVVLDNLRRGSFERPELSGAILRPGDVRDEDDCIHAARDCELIFHLAAQSNVMGSESDPDYTFRTNVAGTWNVLQAARAACVRRIVFASSREVYGDQQLLPVAENRPLVARNLYGASKIAGEAILRSNSCRGTDVSVLRFANVIGPGDSGRVVPRWLNAALAGRPLVVYGGEQIMDFVPAGVAVEALLRASEAGCPVGPINVGSGTATPLLDLASRILEIARSESRLEILPGRDAEVTRFVADVGRMRNELGIDPPADPLESLSEILETLE